MSEIDPMLAITVVASVVVLLRSVIAGARACHHALIQLLRSAPAGTRVAVRTPSAKIQVQIGPMPAAPDQADRHWPAER